MGKQDEALSTLRALFKSKIAVREKCDGIVKVPIRIYSKRSPEFLQEVNGQCHQ